MKNKKELQRSEERIWLELFEEYLYSGDKNKIEIANRVVSTCNDFSALMQLIEKE